MFVADAEMQIERPVSAVYAFLTQPADYARWMNFVKQIDTPTPLAAGQAFQMTSYFQGQRETSSGVVAETAENSRIVLRVTHVSAGPGLLPAWTFTVQPAAQGTLLRWHSEIATQGKMRLLERLYPADTFAAVSRECLFALKYILEKKT
jgi:uncharacterized protein YndB with AHSA1/START domain